MKTKEEIKAKRAATIQKQKEEQEYKKANGIVICRGCNREFQKKDLKLSDYCSWKCALDSRYSNYSMQYGKYIAKIEQCWLMRVSDEAIDRDIKFDFQTKDIRDLAEELYFTESQENLPNLKRKPCGCAFLNPRCVNYHHFKVYNELEQLLMNSSPDDILLYLEQIIKNSQSIVIEVLSYDYDEKSTIKSKQKDISKETNKIQQAREILNRLKKDPRDYYNFNVNISNKIEF